jgi:hypothetical protein
MNTTHISVSFKFDDESLNWLSKNLATIASDFDRNYTELGGPIFNSPLEPSTIEFQKSPVAIQVKKFLISMGLHNSYIQMFGYKIFSKPLAIENVHIDAPGNPPTPLPGRFNILVQGDNNCRMHWWNIGIDHPKVVCTDVPGHGPRWEILGKNKQEKLDLIGAPDYTSGPLSIIQETGDFVRTDIAHSLSRDGQRRMIVSARIYHPWEEIVEKVEKWKNQ